MNNLVKVIITVGFICSSIIITVDKMNIGTTEPVANIIDYNKNPIIEEK